MKIINPILRKKPAHKNLRPSSKNLFSKFYNSSITLEKMQMLQDL